MLIEGVWSECTFFLYKSTISMIRNGKKNIIKKHQKRWTSNGFFLNKSIKSSDSVNCPQYKTWAQLPIFSKPTIGILKYLSHLCRKLWMMLSIKTIIPPNKTTQLQANPINLSHKISKNQIWSIMIVMKTKQVLISTLKIINN